MYDCFYCYSDNTKLQSNKQTIKQIKTEDENYPHARKAIASIMEEELGYKQGHLWSVGEYHIKNTQQPSMINAFHPYYKFTYEEDLDVYVFILVIPYDD